MLCVNHNKFQLIFLKYQAYLVFSIKIIFVEQSVIQAELCVIYIISPLFRPVSKVLCNCIKAKQGLTLGVISICENPEDLIVTSLAYRLS